jgi:hypothetical protein
VPWGVEDATGNLFYLCADHRHKKGYVTAPCPASDCQEGMVSRRWDSRPFSEGCEVCDGLGEVTLVCVSCEEEALFVDEEGFAVCGSCESTRAQKKHGAETDAQLIAAAPELLEAAKAVCFEHADFERMSEPAADAMRWLRAAIDLAEIR